MCGIFGIVLRENNGFSYNLTNKVMKKLFRLSESRGKESSGLAIIDKVNIQVCKSNLSANDMLSLKEFNNFMENNLKNTHFNDGLTIIGHTRLVTNGTDEIHYNNQPVISEDSVAIHNGIIVNNENIWENYPELKREYQIDTEIMLKLIHHFHSNDHSFIDSIKKTYEQIKGTASVAIAFENLDYLLLATNNGSLYYFIDKEMKFIVFASESYILRVLKNKFEKIFENCELQHLEPGNAFLVHLYDNLFTKFTLEIKKDFKTHIIETRKISRLIEDFPIQTQNRINIFNFSNKNSNSKLLYQYQEDINEIKRCTKCLLPFTFPYIEFNEEGVCNYCKNYNKLKYLGKQELINQVKKYRRRDGKPDCLIMFSGGRDSSYMVHYVKNVLKMNPITYTYDWGMVTDLARRNIQRICGELGLEHILVSADIRRKRNNIKKNILAWSKKPDLGMVPLFMAGDKQWYYYANQVKKQLGVKLIFLGTNRLEKTDFKTGFCNISPKKGRIIAPSKSDFTFKLKLLLYYLKNYIKNPFYINTTLLDNISAFQSFYFMEQNYLRLYDYIPWEEKKIISPLIELYNWETAKDTTSTWRIGDGTASFYNYIYYTIAGFTESDTFRSNQIREGILSRNEAFKIVEEENRPRYESIKEYLNIVGLGNKFNEIIGRINQTPKLWKKR